MEIINRELMDRIYDDQIESVSSSTVSRAPTHKADLPLRLVAESRCPEDVIEFGKRHKIPTFAEMTWIRGFVQALELVFKMQIKAVPNNFTCDWCGASFDSESERIEHLHTCSKHQEWVKKSSGSKVIPLFNAKEKTSL